MRIMIKLAVYMECNDKRQENISKNIFRNKNVVWKTMLQKCTFTVISFIQISQKNQNKTQQPVFMNASLKSF